MVGQSIDSLTTHVTQQPPSNKPPSKPKSAPHRKKVRPPGEGGSCGVVTQLPLQVGFDCLLVFSPSFLRC
jgi:hypothetical protein